MSYDFRYIRNKTGELSGPSMVTQTEIALSELGTKVEVVEETANSASEAAAAAQSTADTATSLANTAQSTADKAVALANAAQNTADSAAESGETAQETADKAVELANAAQNTADTATELANAAQTAADTAQDTADSKADIYHASEDTTYGIGSDTLYGHVKLSDSTDDADSNIDDGIAATPAAVAEAMEAAETAQETADEATDLANAAQSYAESLNTNITTVINNLETDVKTYAVTETSIDADDYTEYARLYLTVISSNLPSEATYPLFFGVNLTDDGEKVLQYVISDGMTYTRVGTLEAEEEEEEEEETASEESTTEEATTEETSTEESEEDEDEEDEEDEDEDEDEEEEEWTFTDWETVTAEKLDLATAYKYRGTVDTYDDLPTDAEQGDVYNVDDTGANYAWTGSEWDKLSETVDLSDYVTTSDMISYVSSEVTAIETSDIEELFE